MNAIRFLTDECAYGAIAPALCRAGTDARLTIEADRGGESDASRASRINVTARSL